MSDEYTKEIAREVLSSLDEAMQAYAEQLSDDTHSQDLRVVCGIAVGMAESFAGAMETLTMLATEKATAAHAVKRAIKESLAHLAIAIAKCPNHGQSVQSVLLNDAIQKLSNIKTFSESFNLGEIPAWTPPNVESN